MTIGDVEANASFFLKIDALDDLCYLLEINEQALLRIRDNPLYSEFYVRKQSGGKRLIEDPFAPLQEVQGLLNDYLQSVYYLRRSRAAYGFQLVFSHEAVPRNIKSNAGLHLGKSWMLNADFQDFFHQISRERVFSLFAEPPFGFSEEVAAVLADLCTYKGRLPMGAPTSPVLSNLVSLGLDEDYQDFAGLHNFVYTRFADDLTFSSFEEITVEHQREIVQVASLHGFVFNERKFKLLRPQDTKVVTGLKVAEKVGLQDEYLADLQDELVKYAHTVEVNTRTGHSDSEYLKKHEQILEGHLQFVAFVAGRNDPVYKRLKRQYREAQDTSRYDVVSWLDFDYLYFLGKKK